MGCCNKKIYKRNFRLKLVIISHTEHYLDKNAVLVGWGPTINEINKLIEIVDSIIHIAPLHKGPPPLSSLNYTSSKIKYIAIKPSGGGGIQKISILFKAPYNLYKIYKHTKGADYIQFRAPTGIGIYVLPFLKYFNTKKCWIKYAGNWNDPNMPLGNKMQKWWLQNITSIETKITVNGTWKNERSNVIAFENPCLENKDRALGRVCIKTKRLQDQVNFCFIGALNTHKGVDKILEAFKYLGDNLKIGTLHIVGDGKDKIAFQKLSTGLKTKVVFYGFLKKDEIKEIYMKSHFILLPSKSEGFPKVIGEAMNYGCIPIVSNISCISEYVKENTNGFLIEPNTSVVLKNKILEALNLKQEIYLKWVEYNYLLSDKFTYNHYKNRILSDIFK